MRRSGVASRCASTGDLLGRGTGDVSHAGAPSSGEQIVCEQLAEHNPVRIVTAVASRCEDCRRGRASERMLVELGVGFWHAQRPRRAAADSESEPPEHLEHLIVDGKRRSFWAKTTRGRLLDARHAKAHGLPVAPPRTWMVKAYALDWLEDQRAQVRPGT
jgi:hypothetical protein